MVLENTMAELPAEEVLSDIKVKMENGNKITGIKTGLKDLDYMLDGLHRREVTVIGARPYIGKTCLGVTMANHIAIENKRKTLYFTLKSSSKQLMSRVYSSVGGVQVGKIRNGRLSEKEYKKVMSAYEKIHTSGLFIDDTSAISEEQVKYSCLAYAMDEQIDVVIIDYLQLMSCSREFDNREMEIQHIMNELKRMAVELNIAVVVFSNVNRAIDKKENKRVRACDFDILSLDIVVDNVISLYRDQFYNAETEENGLIDMYILKNEHGDTGKCRMVILPLYSSIVNCEAM